MTSHKIWDSNLMLFSEPHDAFGFEFEVSFRVQGRDSMAAQMDLRA